MKMSLTLILGLLLLGSCSTSPAKKESSFECPTTKAVPGKSVFQQVGYAKYTQPGSRGAARIFTYNFSKASYSSVSKMAKKLMQSRDKMTMAYFYEKKAPYIDQNDGDFIRIADLLASSKWVYKAHLFPSGDFTLMTNERCK